MVAQDDQLLSGSIADNIAFFDPGMDMERVAVAVHAAQIHDGISRMPMQYLSLVGDMGSALSGGQPRLLLLDEGTANLGQQTERVISDRIAALLITRIVIAHRPALIDRAARRLLCAGGRIEELSSGPRKAVSSVS